MNRSRIIAIGLFALGTLAGLFLNVAILWGDNESFLYGYSYAGYDWFDGLDCPIFMARDETAVFAATFHNSSSQTSHPYYEVEMSGLAQLRKFEGQIDVAPGATGRVMWTADKNDIDLGYFVFAHIEILPDSDHRTREATCGVMVFDLPYLTGAGLFGLSFATTLLGLGLGLVLWKPAAGKRTANVASGLRALAVLVLGTLLAGLVGWSIPGIFLLAATLLLLAGLLRLIAAP